MQVQNLLIFFKTTISQEISSQQIKHIHFHQLGGSIERRLPHNAPEENRFTGVGEVEKASMEK